MLIHYQLDFDDILSLQQDVIKHSYTHQIKQSYFKWISAAIIFLALLFSFSLSIVPVVISAIITIVYLLLFPILYEKIAFARAKSKLQQQDHTHILAPCDVTLTEESLIRHINDEITHFAWNTFTHIREDEQRYFLYQTELQGLILPKKPTDLTTDETNKYQSLIHTQISQDSN